MINTIPLGGAITNAAGDVNEAGLSRDIKVVSERCEDAGAFMIEFVVNAFLIDLVLFLYLFSNCFSLVALSTCNKGKIIASYTTIGTTKAK